MAGLAAVLDLQTLMQTEFASDAWDQAELVLDIVSSWARVVSGQSWSDAPSGVPDDVRAVVLQASRRELRNPDRVISREMGPFTATYSAPPDGFFYPAELAILKRFRRTGGLRVLSTTRGEEARPEAGYLHYGDGDVLFPAFSSGEPGYDEAYHLPGSV